MAANPGVDVFHLGALAHLIYRAAFDHHYTAGWKTTLTSPIDAGSVHTHYQLGAWPGSLLVSLPIPDARHIEACACRPSWK
ncbi:MAG: DUF2868 domain-containing protein [Burkholderiales bacterium]|nr:DUF2868 domain-containing protein [Burkholderiales bacterium]